MQSLHPMQPVQVQPTQGMHMQPTHGMQPMPPHPPFMSGPVVYGQMPPQQAMVQQGMPQQPYVQTPPQEMTMQVVPDGGPGSDGLTPAFAQRFAELHAELANTILWELSSNPNIPWETKQSLVAQLQNSIAHTKQPVANAWRTVGMERFADRVAITDAPAAAGGITSMPRQHHKCEVMPLSSLSSLSLPPSSKTTSDAVTTSGDMLDKEGMSCRALTRLFQDPHACGHLTDEAGSEDRCTSTSLAAGVNVKLRHLLLRQNKLTNSFEGSSFACHAEIAYASEVTRTQLPSLTRRLAFFAVLLPIISLAHAPRSLDSWLIITQQVLSIVLPSMLLLVSVWVCHQRKAQRHWRWVVVVTMLLADSCNICSDALLPFQHFTPRDKDFHLLWELARFLVMLCACSMASLCGLNFSHIVVLFSAHFLVYASASTSLYVVWWFASFQGPWTWAIHDTALENRFGGINELNRTCWWLSAHIAGDVTYHAHATHSTILIDCLVLALIASFTNVLALKRLNRSDRISFINSIALQSMVTEQTQLLSGQRIELLAIFSNPSLCHSSADIGPHLSMSGGGSACLKRPSLWMGGGGALLALGGPGRPAAHLGGSGLLLRSAWAPQEGPLQVA